MHLRNECDSLPGYVDVVSAPQSLSGILASAFDTFRDFTRYHCFMPICHEHNLATAVPRHCPFGIRVKLRSTDPFKNLVGQNWTREHWFETRTMRDEALQQMSGRYVYFRPGDQPALEYEKVEKA